MDAMQWIIDLFVWSFCTMDALTANTMYQTKRFIHGPDGFVIISWCVSAKLFNHWMRTIFGVLLDYMKLYKH